jgi:hypothetical protein
MDESALCLGLLVLIVVMVMVAANNKRKRLEAAEEKYRKSLHQLKKAPNSSDQREATLRAGREYARIARENKRETIFDEMALMNDMNAIAGQQVTSQPATVSHVPQGSSVEERLARLRKLADGGHITEEEYSDRRARLLDEI